MSLQDALKTRAGVDTVGRALDFWAAGIRSVCRDTVTSVHDPIWKGTSLHYACSHIWQAEALLDKALSMLSPDGSVRTSHAVPAEPADNATILHGAKP